MKETAIIVSIIIVIIVVGGAMFLFDPVDVENGLMLYRSGELGVQFSYPDKYFIAYEKSLSGERNQHVIVLAENTEENRELFSNPDSATEGPPTIIVTLFQNNLDNYTAKSFIEGNNFSNFKLSDGTTTEVSVGGESGLRYQATGLYDNENVVIARPDYVYMFTAFFNSPTDQILIDFEELLKTIEFSTISEVVKNTPTSEGMTLMSTVLLHDRKNNLN